MPRRRVLPHSRCCRSSSRHAARAIHATDLNSVLGRTISRPAAALRHEGVDAASERAAASRRSPYDKDNAEWMLAQFKEWGWDAQIETFDVLFPTPKERVLEMRRADAFTAKLDEPAVAGDPTSAQQSEQLPDLQRLLHRRRRHGAAGLRQLRAAARTTKSSTGSASPSKARSSSRATAQSGAASSRKSRPSTAPSAA